MKKSTIYKIAGYTSLTVWAAAVLFSERQPKAQPAVQATVQLNIKRTLRPIPLAQPAPPDTIFAQAAPFMDSLKRANKQSEIDKRTPGNLYMQKRIDGNLEQGLVNQQLMFAKVDKLQKALDEANARLAARQDTVYLTPVVVQVDTVYKGLVPIPQNSNRDRKSLERAKEGVERFYRDSIRPGGRSQSIVGYRIS